MQLRILNLIVDFMQVLYSIRKHCTKNEYFPKYIQFTIIYLMQEYKLNPSTYFEKKINISNFVQATENDVHMHAGVQGLILYVFL
jgi:hypothetical protein